MTSRSLHLNNITFKISFPVWLRTTPNDPFGVSLTDFEQLNSLDINNLQLGDSSMMLKRDFREILLFHFQARQQRMPGYSLRAFARDIQVSPSRLSEVLGKGHRLSLKTASRVATNIGLSNSEKAYFHALVEAEYLPDGQTKTLIDQRLKVLEDEEVYRNLYKDELKAITEWIHFAILEALDLEDCPDIKSEQEKWLAKKLKRSPVETFGALRRLVRLKLVNAKDGRYKKTGANFASTHDVPSAELRQIHQDLIQQGIAALNREPITRRCVNSLLLGIDKAKAPEAFNRLFEFCRDFNREFGSESRKTDVYCLSLQFFPLTEDRGHDGK